MCWFTCVAVLTMFAMAYASINSRFMVSLPSPTYVYSEGEQRYTPVPVTRSPCGISVCVFVLHEAAIRSVVTAALVESDMILILGVTCSCA